MPGQIFISYRRNDAAYVTGHINDRLCEEFGAASIFTDVDNIALGVDFRAVLDEKVGQCQILLAVIGANWLGAKNQAGELRLQDPADFVRIEIESALKRSIPVIPLLIAGTTMPSKDELPESLQDLSFRNGTQIRPVPDFHADIDRLIHSLRKHLLSLSTETGKEPTEQSADEARRKNDQKKEPAVSDIILDRRQDDDRPGFTETNVIPEDDERARHQIELTRDQTKKRRAATIFKSLLAVLVVVAAGVSWYIDFEYAEQYDSAIASLAALQGSASDDEAELMADAAALARGAANVVAASNLESETIAEAQGEIDTISEVQPEPEAITEAEGDPELIAAADSEGIIEDTLESEDVAEVQSENETIEAAQVEAATDAQLKLDATAAFREGSSLAALGNHEAAIQQFDLAIPLIAEPAFVLKQRGTSYHALGNYTAAVEDFSEAIRLNAEDANAFFKRGAAYQELEDYVAAIASYDEAIRLNPEFAAAFQSRGTANELLGNQVAAERDLAVATGLRTRQSDP
jgi:tetratricopeptide (TPR) repeat protein